MQTGMRGAIEQAYRRFGASPWRYHTAAGIVGDNGLQEINDCQLRQLREALSGQGARLDGVGRSA